MYVSFCSTYCVVCTDYNETPPEVSFTIGSWPQAPRAFFSRYNVNSSSLQGWRVRHSSADRYASQRTTHQHIWTRWAEHRVDDLPYRKAHVCVCACVTSCVYVCIENCTLALWKQAVCAYTNQHGVLIKAEVGPTYIKTRYTINIVY